MAASLAIILLAFPGLTGGITLTGRSVDVAADIAVGGSSMHWTAHYLRKRELEHEASLADIMHNMTLGHAASILRSHRIKVPIVLLQMQMVETEQSHSQLGGVDKAKDLLNSMLEEVAEQYDTEVDRCCDFATAQSIFLEEIKQDIAYQGASAAEAREKILTAEQEIEVTEAKIPLQRNELAEHEAKCEKDKSKIKEELNLILADIRTMSMILGLTSCKTTSSQKTLLLLACNCSGEEVFAVDDEELHQATSGLASSTAQQLLQEGFRDVSDSDQADFDGNEQRALNRNGTSAAPVQDKNDMGVRTVISGSPCKVPSVVDKRASKCSVRTNPNCQRLQERFLLIQADILDKRDELQSMLASIEKNCEETTDSYDAEIKGLSLNLKDHQTKLATATESLNTANEQSRVKSGQFERAKLEWSKQTKICQQNYLNLESQECGMKKIRAELFKMQSKTTTTLIQDCVVSGWEPGECSKSCEGGTMIVSRSIVAPPKDGMKCLPLAKTKECNTFSCPIHCKMDDWEGWSSCSAECGGGLMERTRKVERRARYNGNPCEASTQAVTCNAFACDADCELHDWTAWSQCSKMCGGGTRKRIKAIKTAATGDGKCPAQDDKKREEYIRCNTHACLPKLSTLRCNTELDVVLLLDGSGSIGQRGWDATKKVGKALAKAFHSSQADIQLSTILYSGPRTWRGIRNCGGGSPPMVWTTMYAKGNFGSIDPGASKFNEMFKQSHLGILRRQCMWCRRAYKDIYFRWFGDKSEFNAWDGLMVTWRDRGFRSDFNLYSSLSDALQGRNPWRYCNGNDPNIGFPRDCARSRGSRRGWQWQSLTRGGQSSIRWRALGQKTIDLEKDCSIKFVNHFTNDTAKVQGFMDAMTWPKGATLTSLALQAAEEELPLSGRSETKSVVIVLTDGKPMSKRKTWYAAKSLRKKARLMFVPVTRYAPRKDIKRWASKPWSENFVDVKSFADLTKPAIVNEIVSDLCPKNS